MAFKIKARVLMELGAELISSDGIAIYELIKNAIDAGSEAIEVRVHVALMPSGYRTFDAELEEMSSVVSNEQIDSVIARNFDASAPAALKDTFRATLVGKRKPRRERR